MSETSAPAGAAGFEFPPPVQTMGQESTDYEVARPLAFPPLSNVHVVGLASVDVLDESQLQSIRADLELGPIELLPLFATAVEQANASFFRFSLTGIDERDNPSLVTLQTGGWLPGLTEAHSTRKLTVVLPIEVATASGSAIARVDCLGKESLVKPGAMLIYPSYLYPLVALNHGEHLTAFVAHAFGPSFR